MTPSPSHVLIVGASRGIGLALVEALLARPTTQHLYAAARGATRSDALAALAATAAGRLTLIDVDVGEESSIEACVHTVQATTQQLDWVINTVGLLHDSDGMMPERRLGEVTASNILKSMTVNCVGPVLLAKHVAGLLPRATPCVVATLSARVGSIEDNRLGGWYAYRASKAAQNMLTKNLAIELKRRHKAIRCVALHPGTVDTDLSAPFSANSKTLFSARTAAGHLLNVLDNLNDDDNGKFFAWDGQTIAW
ncbi:MAG: SDR family NAD(P)-dependent oxidoreductase [Pseudomonadota bacterium]